MSEVCECMRIKSFKVPFTGIHIIKDTEVNKNQLLAEQLEAALQENEFLREAPVTSPTPVTDALEGAYFIIKLLCACVVFFILIKFYKKNLL